MIATFRLDRSNYGRGWLEFDRDISELVAAYGHERPFVELRVGGRTAIAPIKGTSPRSIEIGTANISPAIGLEDGARIEVIGVVGAPARRSLRERYEDAFHRKLMERS